jgi:hypothetical protein
VGAVSGQSRGWARPVVETEGPQADGSGRSGAGSCPQSITRENKKFKKLNTTKVKSKRKENKEKQAPGPPPYLFRVRPFVLAKWLEALAGAVPNSRILGPAGLSSWIPVAPHLYTLETSHPACRRRPAHATRISADRPRKPRALAQKSEQGHAGVHQTHVASRRVGLCRRDR